MNKTIVGIVTAASFLVLTAGQYSASASKNERDDLNAPSQVAVAKKSKVMEEAEAAAFLNSLREASYNSSDSAASSRRPSSTFTVDQTAGLQASLAEGVAFLAKVEEIDAQICKLRAEKARYDTLLKTQGYHSGWLSQSCEAELKIREFIAEKDFLIDPPIDQPMNLENIVPEGFRSAQPLYKRARGDDLSRAHGEDSGSTDDAIQYASGRGIGNVRASFNPKQAWLDRK